MHESETNQKRDKFRDNRIRCKVLTQDGYTNRLFLMKSSKGIRKVAIQYDKDISDLSLFSFISFPKLPVDFGG